MCQQERWIPKGVDIVRCANEDAGPEGREIVRFHIGWRGEGNILYEGVDDARP